MGKPLGANLLVYRKVFYRPLLQCSVSFWSGALPDNSAHHQPWTATTCVEVWGYDRTFSGRSSDSVAGNAAPRIWCCQPLCWYSCDDVARDFGTINARYH